MWGISGASIIHYWYYITFEHPELSTCGHIWKCPNCFTMANTWWALLILDVMSSSVPPDVVMLQRYTWRCLHLAMDSHLFYSNFFLTLKIFFLSFFYFLRTLKFKKVKLQRTQLIHTLTISLILFMCISELSRLS